jgi:hypothetical protein
MYYRRQGEPQGMSGNNSALTSSDSYQTYYKEDFTVLDPSMSDTQRYVIYGIVAAVLILLFWLLWKQYGHKMSRKGSRKGSVSMFY